MPPDSAPLAPNAWLRWDSVAPFVSGRIGDVLEIGCGQGGFGVRLARMASSYRAYEPDPTSFRVAAERISAVPNSTVYNDFLPSTVDEQADLVCAFEVLEHLEDDSGAIELWRSWIRPGGRMLISVPAHQSRYGPWDAAVGHYRRYSRSELTDLLAGTGLERVQVAGYGFPLGFVLEWGRDRLAPAPEADFGSMTTKSGRLFQPMRSVGRILGPATFPFRLLQRPFRNGDLNTGWVAVGDVPR